MSDSPRYDPKISEADVLAIQSVIHALPDVDHRILYAGIETDGTVRVRTGVIYGPRAGRGNFVTLERMKDTWRVKSVGHWIA